jgi:hypothetical protein
MIVSKLGTRDDTRGTRMCVPSEEEWICALQGLPQTTTNGIDRGALAASSCFRIMMLD